MDASLLVLGDYDTVDLAGESWQTIAGGAEGLGRDLAGFSDVDC